MTIIGYVRASTIDQEPSLQEAALRVWGCNIIRVEKRSDTSIYPRKELQTILDRIGPGDTLMVTRLDRLARDLGDLQIIARRLRARGATLRATEQPIDTGRDSGRHFVTMLGVFAEFEMSLRRERQLEGIARAKAKGVYLGRPPQIDQARVRALRAQGMKPAAIAKALGICRASVYRALGGRLMFVDAEAAQEMDELPGATSGETGQQPEER